MQDRAYSINEAAYVTERPAKALTREFDEGVLNNEAWPKADRTRTRVREFGVQDLRFFRLMKYWEKDFTPDGRIALYRSVRQMKPTQKVLELRNARLDMAPIDAELKIREASLEALKRNFVAKGGDAFFKGTDLSAYRIAALGKSQSVEEIAHDYPSLTIDMVRNAIDYDRVYPKKGKPYPPRSLKRMLQEGADGLGNEELNMLFGAETDGSGAD